MRNYVLDISGHNGEVDFAKVKAAGITGVMLKCTEGDSYLAPKFLPNYKKALAAGLKVGAYHFLRGSKVAAAAKEGRWFGQCCQGLTLELGLALDIEHEGVNWDGNAVTAADAYQMVNTFAQSVAQYDRAELFRDKSMWLYASKDYFSRFLKDSALEAYPKWLANPSKLDFDRTVKMVQYSWSGSVEGVEKPVDLNVLLEDSQVIDMAQLHTAPSSFSAAQKAPPLYRIVGSIGAQQVDLQVYKG